MSQSGRWVVTLIVAWGVSWLVVFDAFSYVLRPLDPSTGRMRGCYTAVELLVGAKEPSALIRDAEQLVGGVLFVGVPLIVVSWAVRGLFKRRRDQMNGRGHR
jgi:hypothetical protein